MHEVNRHPVGVAKGTVAERYLGDLEISALHFLKENSLSESAGSEEWGEHRTLRQRVITHDAYDVNDVCCWIRVTQ